MQRIAIAVSFVLAIALAPKAGAGPFLNPSIAATSPLISAWADGVVSFSPTPSGSGSAASALGAANGALVSLGDLTAAEIAGGAAPGSITLSFSQPIYDGTGPDLAVFENAGAFFPAPFVFGELAYVEVSSNGVDFARFPSISLNTLASGNADTDLITTFGRGFAGINTTNVHNLAGIHPTGFGTLFDLSDLLADPLVTSLVVDLSAIAFVRLVDVPGDGSFFDSLGNPILDAWVTAGTGGLDLDAIAALHVVPEPGTALLVSIGVALLARRRRA